MPNTAAPDPFDQLVALQKGAASPAPAAEADPFDALKTSMDDGQRQLAELTSSKDFDPLAYASQHEKGTPEFDTAFKVHQARKAFDLDPNDPGFFEKAKNAGKGVAQFFAGAPAAAWNLGAMIGDKLPESLGGGNEADAQKHATMAMVGAQTAEQGISHVLNLIPGVKQFGKMLSSTTDADLAKVAPVPNMGRMQGSQIAHILTGSLPEEEKINTLKGGGLTDADIASARTILSTPEAKQVIDSASKPESDYDTFASKVADFKTNAELAQGKVQDTGAVADAVKAASGAIASASAGQPVEGMKPSEIFSSPEDLKAMGAPLTDFDKFAMQSMGTAADPTNLVFEAVPKIPGVATSLKASGRVMEWAGNVMPAIIKKYPLASKVAGATTLGAGVWAAAQHAPEIMAHKGEAAGVAALALTLAGMGKVMRPAGRFLYSAGEMAAGKALPEAITPFGIRARQAAAGVAGGGIFGAGLEGIKQAEGEDSDYTQGILSGMAFGGSMGALASTRPARQFSAAQAMATRGAEIRTGNALEPLHDSILGTFQPEQRDAVNRLRAHLHDGAGVDLIVTNRAGIEQASGRATGATQANPEGVFLPSDPFAVSPDGKTVYLNVDAITGAAGLNSTAGHEVGHTVVDYLKTASRSADAMSLFDTIRESLGEQNYQTFANNYREAIAKGFGVGESAVGDIRDAIQKRSDEVAKNLGPDATQEDLVRALYSDPTTRALLDQHRDASQARDTIFNIGEPTDASEARRSQIPAELEQKLGRKPTPREIADAMLADKDIAASYKLTEEALAEITSKILDGEDISNFALPKRAKEKVLDAASRFFESMGWKPKVSGTEDLDFRGRDVAEAARQVRDVLYEQGAKAKAARQRAADVAAGKVEPTVAERLHTIGTELAKIDALPNDQVKPSDLERREQLVNEAAKLSRREEARQGGVTEPAEATQTTPAPAQAAPPAAVSTPAAPTGPTPAMRADVEAALKNLGYDQKTSRQLAQSATGSTVEELLRSALATRQGQRPSATPAAVEPPAPAATPETPAKPEAASEPALTNIDLTRPENETQAEAQGSTSTATAVQEPPRDSVPQVSQPAREAEAPQPATGTFIPETDQVAQARANYPEGPVRDTIDTLDANRGKVVWVKDYNAAQKTAEGYAGEEARTGEIRKQGAKKRKAGAEGTYQDKPFIPVEIRVNKDGEPYVNGFDVDVMLSNLRTITDFLNAKGLDNPLEGDASVQAALEAYNWNHANGFDGAGTKRLRAPGPDDRLPEPNPDAEPRPLAVDALGNADVEKSNRIADILNMAVNSKPGEIGGQEAGKAVALALFNGDTLTGAAETNPLRTELNAAGFDGSQLSKRSAFYGRLSADLVKGGVTTERPSEADRKSVRLHGYDIDLAKAFAPGKPQFEAVAAGYKPSEGERTSRKSKIEEALGSISFKPSTADENAPKEIDPRTGRPTFIPAGKLTAEQSKAASDSLDAYYRSYGDAIKSATDSGTDEAFAKVAEVLPKIELADIGLKFVRDDIRPIDDNDTIKFAGRGGESRTFVDGDVAYKIFPPIFDIDTGEPTIGITGRLVNYGHGWRYDYVRGDLGSTLDKLRVISKAGGIPSELLGVTSGGALVVKQPRYPNVRLRKLTPEQIKLREELTNKEEPTLADLTKLAELDSIERNASAARFIELHDKAQSEAPARDKSEADPWRKLPGDLQRVTVVDGTPYGLSDMSGSNYAVDNQGDMRITDLVSTPLPDEFLRDFPKIAEQVEKLKEAENFARAEVAFKPQHDGKRLEHSIKDKSLKLVHYTNAVIEGPIDPAKMKPKAGVYDYMYRGEPKSFFFVEGSMPKDNENVTARGKSIYEAEISGARIYDMDADPLNKWGVLNPAKADSELMDLGYAGFSATTKDGRRFVAMYEPTDAVKRDWKEEIARKDRIKNALSASYKPGDGSEEMRRILEEYVPNFHELPVEYFEQQPATPAQVAKQNAIAKAYEGAKLDNLTDPNVRRAYESLVEKVNDQYDRLLDDVQVLPWADKQADGTWKTRDGQPYATSKAMMDDMRDNKRLYFFITTPESFGSSENFSAHHPMFQDSGKVTENGYPLLNNDILRVVHDAIAHGSFGVQFGPHGEEAAWRAHMATINDPWARWALTTETRGQNSWVNYRDEYLRPDGTPKQKGDEGYVPPPQRPFADQKADLLDPKFMLTGVRAVDEVVTTDPEFRKAAGLPDDLRDSGGRFMPRSAGEEAPSETTETQPLDLSGVMFKPKTERQREAEKGLQELDFGKRYTPEALSQQSIKRRATSFSSKFPEAIEPKYRKDENGKFILDESGRPSAEKLDYNLYESPLAKQAAKGIRGEDKRSDAIATAYAQKLVDEYHRVADRQDIMDGKDWYELARGKITDHFGDDSLLFAQLLGATSARTPARENFEQALEAYNKFKNGDYDGYAERYLDLENKLENGEPLTFTETYSKEVGKKQIVIEAGTPVDGTNFKFFLDQQGVLPKKGNGKEYNANSLQVLRVIAGNWEQKVGGPKTPNFARNLSGKGENPFEATIDVWAARGLHRLGNEGLNDKRWRIMPESEQGVQDADFFLGQAAYRKAAEQLGIKPDALQGVLWFAEKDVWAKRGWTRGTGAELSDFNTLLDRTEVRDGKKVLAKEPDPQHSLFDLDLATP